jgi:hypothetical protein
VHIAHTKIACYRCGPVSQWEWNREFVIHTLECTLISNKGSRKNRSIHCAKYKEEDVMSIVTR